MLDDWTAESSQVAGSLGRWDGVSDLGRLLMKLADASRSARRPQARCHHQPPRPGL